jgi:predicted transport protein
MNKLIQVIEAVRSKIDGLHKHDLKETPTRTIVIDPLLEALGWDVRDPDEVQLEFPTVDGRSVDYGLKLNRKCVLLVEAKAFSDPLTDVKAITQIVNYANSDGIIWCILTNGLTWKVYRSIENCPAPDKLMYEVSIDPRGSENMPVQEIAQRMWRFSRDEIAKGTLDALGEQTFTDGKVRKALDALMADPSKPFLKMLRVAAGDGTLTPQQIKESVARIWGTGSSPPKATVRTGTLGSRARSKPERPARTVRVSRKGTETASIYTESHHTSDKPREAIELYRAVDQFCLSLQPGVVERRYLAKYISYVIGKETFCSLHILRGGLRVWLKLKYNRLDSPPSFARDMSGIGHWGTGDFELAVNSRAQLEEGLPFVRMSFDASAG